MMKNIKKKLAVVTTGASLRASTMKKLSIATAGAAFVALGTFGVAPANATVLTQVDYSGTASISIFGQSVWLPVNTSSIIDNLSGRLSDAGDSELTIDNPLSYLGSDFNDLLNVYNASINSLTGSGSVSNNNGFLSAFNFSYDNANDVFTVSNYDFDSIQVCLSSTCNISGQGDYAGRMYGLIRTNGTISFNLNQTATLLPDSPVVPEQPIVLPVSDSPVVTEQPTVLPVSDSPLVTELPTLLSVSDSPLVTEAPTVLSVSESRLVTEPSSVTPASSSQSVPEPSALLGLIGFGGFLAAKRKQRKAA